MGLEAGHETTASCIVEEDVQKDEYTVNSSLKKNCVLDSSDSDAEMGTVPDDQDESTELLGDISEKLEKVERLNAEVNKQVNRKQSNSSSNEKTNYRPGPVKSKRKSFEKERSNGKSQKDKKLPDERKMEKHHSQGFKIPRVSSSNNADSVDKIALGSKEAGEGLNSQGNQNPRSSHQQEKQPNEKLNQKHKLEKRISLDKLEKGKSRIADL